MGDTGWGAGSGPSHPTSADTFKSGGRSLKAGKT